MEKILRKVMQAILFCGDTVYLPTVLLFWYFVSFLISMPLFDLFDLPSSYFSGGGGVIGDVLGEYFSLGIYLGVVVRMSPASLFLESLGIIPPGGWGSPLGWPGDLLVFSVVLLVVFVINFSLGKILFSLFKVQRSKGKN